MTVAATFGPAPSTKATASAVVICSNTIFSAGKSRDQRREHALDEHRLAVENVDLGIGDLAMDEQRHADPLHRLQRRAERGDVGHAVRRIGRRVGRIELGGRPHARLEAARDLRRDRHGR